MRLYAGSPYDLDHALAEAPTAREAAHRMLVAAAKAFTGEATFRGCLLASAAASGTNAAADVQAEIAKMRSEIQQRLEHRIDKDVTDNVLPAETSSQALAAMVIMLIQGMSVLAREGAARQQLLDAIAVATQAWPERA